MTNTTRIPTLPKREGMIEEKEDDNTHIYIPKRPPGETPWDRSANVLGYHRTLTQPGGRLYPQHKRKFGRRSRRKASKKRSRSKVSKRRSYRKAFKKRSRR